MSNFRSFAIAACWLWLALCSSCAKSKGPEAGTNTNWLQACGSNADCEGDGECLCGVCTLACASDATCESVGKGVTCTKASADRCSDGTTGSVCLPAVVDGGAAPDDGASTDAGLSLTRVGDAVQVTDRYRPCGLDQDCVLVDRSCSNCCNYDAIRDHDSAAFASQHELACEGFIGPVCMCGVSELVPICRSGTCAAVTPEAIRLCYAPSQNLQRAGDPDAVGCECDVAGVEICVDGVPLQCAGFANNLRWRLADDDVCSSVCRGAPDCVGAECEHVPLGNPAACTMFGHLWEGTCGDVHYRIHDQTLQNPGAAASDLVSWYWDVNTGELLAKREPADEGTCDERYIVRGDPQVVNDCLALLDRSTQLCPPGEAGAGWCSEALDCNEFDCSYDPYTAGCDGGIHVHEGVCGDIRYRNMVSIGGSTWYWSASSGELEAVVIGGDVSSSCRTVTHGRQAIVDNCELVIDATTAICP